MIVVKSNTIAYIYWYMNKRSKTNILIVQTAGTNFSYHTLTLKLMDNCKYNTVDPRSMGTCLISTP